MRFFSILTYFFFIFSGFFFSSAKALTLEQAWHQVEKNNPSIDAARANLAIAHGQRIQAELIPNPTFTTIQGNVPGFGKYSHNPNAESTYIINQLIETGGKRGARYNVANAQYHANQTAYQVNRAELFGQTVQAFLSVAETETKLRLSKLGVSLNKQTISTVNERINAGKASAIDLQAAQIALSDQRLAKATIESELASAKFTLANLWKGSENEVQKIVEPSLRTMPLYDLSFYLQKTKNNWELQALCQAQKIANAQIRLANAKKYPDVTVGVGIQHFNQNSEPKSHNAVIAEFGVPIPIFDRNQGNIVSATDNFRKSIDDLQNKELSLKSNIVKTYQIASQARLQINILKNSILPQSLLTLKLAKHGYQQGRFSYLDLLSAQQKLLDAQMREVTALFLYSRAWYVLQISIGALPRKDCA